MKKNKERLHDLCYIENRTYLQIIEVPGGCKWQVSCTPPLPPHVPDIYPVQFPLRRA